MAHLQATEEWSRLYRAKGGLTPQVLHARFVRHEFSRHVHDEYVIGLIESGIQRFDLGRAALQTPAGSVFLINPGEPHTGGPGAATGYVYRTVYLSADLVASMGAEVGTSASELLCFATAVVADAELSALLGRYHRSLIVGASALEQETFLLAAVRLVLLRYGAKAGRPPRATGGSRLAMAARSYLDANYAENVSLAGLAEACSSSPYHLARTFTAHFGIPPHEYLTGRRIARTKQLLDVGMNLAVVALEVGFADQSHLTRRFKELVGISPGRYARADRGARSFKNAPSRQR